MKEQINNKLIALGIPQSRIDKWLDAITETAERFDIRDNSELSVWLAQMAHESQKFKKTTENLNYSVTALRRLWKRRFTVEQAKEYGRSAKHSANQRMIANLAYGGRLGNEAYPSNDGWNYRGRGLIMITGKINYELVSATLDIPIIVDYPDIVQVPSFASLTAGAWWSQHQNAREAAKDLDIKEVSLVVNGGLNGLEDRMELTDRILAA